MNFENLSTEGYVAFILAIIFSIVTIASAIYFARHQKINLTLNIFITLVFPILTIFCWAYLFMNLYAFDFAMSMYVSLGAALGYGVVAFALSLLITFFVKRSKTPKENNVEIEHKIVPEANVETKDETPAEDNIVVAPLLIATETPVEETESQLDKDQETEVVSEEVETVETEPATEEVVEGSAEEIVEENQPAEVEVNETTEELEVDEPAVVEDEIVETDEAAVEEETVEEQVEIQPEEVVEEASEVEEKEVVETVEENSVELPEEVTADEQPVETQEYSAETIEEVDDILAQLDLLDDLKDEE